MSRTCCNETISNGLVEIFDACLQVVERLPAEAFGTPFEDSSSIGAHMRHVIELSGAFFQGMESGIIDFDNRAREQSLERDKRAALTALRALRNASSIPFDALHPLELRARCSASQDTVLLPSSTGREAQYVIDHAVHHLAIIKLLAPRLGVHLPEKTGMAAGTIIHRQAAAG